MNLNRYQDYLLGRQFSNGLDVQVSDSGKYIQTRIDCLVNLVKDKNIIHVGCTDHIEIIDRKIAKKR